MTNAFLVGAEVGWHWPCSLRLVPVGFLSQMRSWPGGPGCSGVGAAGQGPGLADHGDAVAAGLRGKRPAARMSGSLLGAHLTGVHLVDVLAQNPRPPAGPDVADLPVMH